MPAIRTTGALRGDIVPNPTKRYDSIVDTVTQAPASIIPAGAMELPARHKAELKIEQLAQSLSRVAVAKSSTADDADMDNLIHSFSAAMAADMNTLSSGTTLLQESTNTYPVSDAVFQVPIYFHKTHQPNSPRSLLLESGGNISRKLYLERTPCYAPLEDCHFNVAWCLACEHPVHPPDNMGPAPGPSGKWFEAHLDTAGHKIKKAKWARTCGLLGRIPGLHGLRKLNEQGHVYLDRGKDWARLIARLEEQQWLACEQFRLNSHKNRLKPYAGRGRVGKTYEKMKWEYR